MIIVSFQFSPRLSVIDYARKFGERYQLWSRWECMHENWL